MPRRSILLLMLAGGGALLAALVLLWQSTRSEAVTSAPTTAVREPTGPAAPAPSSPSAPSAPAARVGKLGSPPSAPVAPSRSSGTPAPAPIAATENSPDQETRFGGLTLFRAQATAVEPLVRECVEKATATGIRPTGNAILTHVVAKQGDQFVIEDTGFDTDQTTLQSEGLLQCLHQTAKQMKYEGLPRNAQALYVMRSIKLEQGAITEYRHVGFSYLR